MTRNVSLSEQIEQYEDDRALLDPVLKEARQDRDEIKRLRKLLTRAHHYLPAGSLIRADVEAERPWRDD